MWVTQSCLTLCDPKDYSPPGSSVHGIFQARIPEWVAISFSRASSWPRDQTWVSCIADKLFTIWATREVINILPSKRILTTQNPPFCFFPPLLFLFLFFPDSFLGHLYFLQPHNKPFLTLYPSKPCPGRLTFCILNQPVVVFHCTKSLWLYGKVNHSLGRQKQLPPLGISKRLFVLVDLVMHISVISVHMCWQMLGWLRGDVSRRRWASCCISPWEKACWQR